MLESMSALVVLALPAFAQLKDFDGHPLVTKKAPVLAFKRRDQPLLEGIDYPFPEQTAHGAAVLSRFPPFRLSDRRIHVDGPWYDSDEANLHFSRGIASVGALPRYRERDDAPTTVRFLPRERKWMLMTDPMWWAHAIRLADLLAVADPEDPRIPALREFGREHCFTEDREAFLALGRFVLETERWPADGDGTFVRYPSIDIERTQGWEFQRSCIGWLYQGMGDAGRELGLEIVPILYGQWQFSVGCFWESKRQAADSYPTYLRPDRDFLAGPDPTLTACQALGGVLSMDGYQQALWGLEPFHDRGSDGSLHWENGAPTFSERHHTSAYGCSLRLESGEARKCLDDLYRTALRMYLQHHRRAGGYPARSDLRKPFLTRCRIGAWSRYTNEGLQGIEQNDRPLPPWLLETIVLLYLFTADDIVIWSSDMNFVPGPLGGDYRSAWAHNAHGVLESVVKAAHRYSSLDPLHAGGMPFRWCWFSLPVVNENRTLGDRYHEKPIAIGKLRPFEGGLYLELFLAWPGRDHQPTDITVWVEQNGHRSPSYHIRLPDGRHTFLDAWRLPAGFDDAEGRDVYLRTTDETGIVRTWRGDWRVPVDS